jgi:hypothetical protein
MAWTTNKPAVLETSASTLKSYTLDAKRAYVCQHVGLNAAGSVDANEVVLHTDKPSMVTKTIDYTQAGTKCVLKGGETVVIGPGIALLQYQSMGGAPVFNISPIERRI